MKRTLAIAVTLALLFSFAASCASDDEITGMPLFGPEDMSVYGLQYNALTDEARLSLGEPDMIKKMTVEATGEEMEIWSYNNLTLSFNAEGRLVGAVVYGNAFPGPRDVQVGQKADEVVRKFYVNPAAATNGVLYSAGFVEALGAQLPPFGVVNRFEDGTFTIEYAAPAEPFGEDILADPTDFVYCDLALFTIRFDQTATVTDFSWQMGPWAE